MISPDDYPRKGVPAGHLAWWNIKASATNPGGVAGDSTPFRLCGAVASASGGAVASAGGVL